MFQVHLLKKKLFKNLINTHVLANIEPLLNKPWWYVQMAQWHKSLQSTNIPVSKSPFVMYKVMINV